MGSALLLLLAGGGGVIGTLIFVLIFVANYPEKAERIAGWFAALVAKVFDRADRAAVGWKVQGDVNSARAELLRSVPEKLIDKKLKIKWADAGEAEALLRDGEVLVVMQRSDHHEENVAHALMAYLPKTMLPRARRYVDHDRMRAADLIVAKGLLVQTEKKPGTLSVFFEEHLDPARSEGADLNQKINELDQIDMHGWLTRLVLAEYLRLGDELHPGEPDSDCKQDAEEFVRWAHRLATREPGEEKMSLSYEGRYFRVAIIFVGIKDRLLEEGLIPYRKRVKRYLYRDRFNAIYLMARDDSIHAVEALVGELEHDGRVASATRYTYALRDDFSARYGLDRERAMIACLRRKQVGEPPPEPQAEFQLEVNEADDDGLPEERYTPEWPEPV